MTNSVLWAIVVFFGGGFVLAAVIAWAMKRNSATKSQEPATERATRDLYDGDTVDRTTL